MPTTILKTRDGKLDDDDRHKLVILAERLSARPSNVLLYLHGGLVDLVSADAMANRLSATGDASFNIGDDWEQVYILWRTGLVETIRTNWSDIFHNDPLYAAMFKRMVSFVSSRFGDGRGGRGDLLGSPMSDFEIETRMKSTRPMPFGSLDLLAESEARGGLVETTDDTVRSELEVALTNDHDLIAIGDNIDAVVAKDTSGSSRSTSVGDTDAGRRTLGLVDAQIREEWSKVGPIAPGRAFVSGGTLLSLARHGIEIGLRVVQRFRTSRDHGVHATIAEEIAREFYGDRIGASVWKMMVDDAAQHFLDDGLGSEILNVLKPLENVRLVIVGHSAGSIWATEMLTARKKIANQAPIDLVLLAPAVRISKFAEMLRVAAEDIRLFRLFAMTDVQEKADALLGPGFGFIYPSSLLYLVSGLFEIRQDLGYHDAPLLGMERFISETGASPEEDDEAQAVSEVRHFLAAAPSRIVLSGSSSKEGLRSSALSHGGFNDDPETLKSILHYIS